MPISDHTFFMDAWGNEIKYVTEERSGEFQIVLYSFGRNGRDDGTGGDDVAVVVTQSLDR
jgi:hypothetical protein